MNECIQRTGGIGFASGTAAAQFSSGDLRIRAIPFVDFFTGKPVIVCDAAGFAGIDTDAFPPKGFRLLPIVTVSGSGMIPVFQPDEVVIYTEQTGRCQQVDALVGLGERGNGMAIFHPRVLC